jgi:hypothetical protein
MVTSTREMHNAMNIEINHEIQIINRVNVNAPLLKAVTCKYDPCMYTIMCKCKTLTILVTPENAQTNHE